MMNSVIADLADREAIRACLYRYCRAIDRVDADLLLSVYWPDATDEHGNFIANSAREFVDRAIPILRGMERTTHFIGNILIELNEDVAHVETYIQAVHRLRRDDGSLYDNMSFSRFIDRMERRGDEWRIKKRLVLRDWFREFPDAVDWGSGEMPRRLGYGKERPLATGARKPDDRSYELLSGGHGR